MKRGLVLSLAALALVVGNAAVKAADIDVSLNLRYTDPANPAEGGQWFLLAKTNVAAANTGLAGLNVYLSNINSTVAWGNGTAVGGYPVVTQGTLGANVSTAGNLPFNFTDGSVTNVVYGQDLVTKTVTIGEGAGSPGIVATDPLKNAAWNNSTLLMSGTFAGGGNAGNQFNRPAFVSYNGNSADGTLYDGSGAIAAGTPSISTTVRGDSLFSLGLNTPATAGLRPGDTNRDGAVGPGDLATIGSNWGPTATTRTWDQGDFNNDGAVGPGDLALIGSNWNPTGTNFVAPQLAAVPEPASVALAGMCCFGLLAARKRR